MMCSRRGGCSSCYGECSSGFCVCAGMRRHTRCYRDWSSDVCSSDLEHVGRQGVVAEEEGPDRACRGEPGGRSEERRVGKSVDLGGRRILKKKKEKSETRLARPPGPRRQGRWQARACTPT